MRNLLALLLLLPTIATAGQFYAGCAPKAHLLEIPSTFDFGSIAPGADTSLVVSIMNDGDAGSVLQGFVRTENCNAAWSIPEGGGPYSLEVGEVYLYTVRYAPTTEDGTCFAADSCCVEVGE